MGSSFEQPSNEWKRSRKPQIRSPTTFEVAWKKNLDLNYKCFVGKKLKFEEKSQMTSDFLWILQVQNIFFSDQLENPRQLNITEIFNGESVQIERGEDENFVLCFQNLKNETLSLVVVDTDGNIKIAPRKYSSWKSNELYIGLQVV